MPSDQYPQVELPLDLKNIASVMASVGYQTPYKGKWHLSKPLGADWAPADLAQYGFDRWNPPDGGANQDVDQFGGGVADNDGRFMNDGDMAAGAEGVLAYLSSTAAQEQPFFFVVSLVNPHDVLSYPKEYIDGGYENADLVGPIDVPRTVDEDLGTKPSAQESFLRLTALGLGRLRTKQQQRAYLNFYGNLMKRSDAYLVEVLDLLAEKDLLENTLVIQTSDHGELGLAHGGLRQKNFNVYEETMRVSLVFSNPILYQQPRQSSAMVSHVDLLPTLASLFGAPAGARANWEGVDYSRIVLDPGARGVQDYVVFTYDDWQAGQKSGPYVRQPNHITSIRESRYKLAKYLDPDGDAATEWEMYDLHLDPLKTKNIAGDRFPRTAQQQQELRRLKAKLATVQQRRLRPL